MSKWMLGRLVRFFNFRKLYMVYRTLDPGLARIIIDDSSDFPVVNRRLCIVFWDLSGYSRASYLASASDMEAQAIGFSLDFFDRLGQVVNSHGGILHKYTGDGAMAIFGLENSDAELAVNGAVEAAVLLREEMPGLMKRECFSDFCGNMLLLRCGIHYCVARYGLAKLRHMNTAVLIGHGVNVASRLCDASRNSEILISADAGRFLSAHHYIGMQEPLVLKNIPEPQWAGYV